MKILICSLLRDAGQIMERWWDLLKEVTIFHPAIEFDLAIYENDSQDTTKSLIDSLVKEECENYFSQTYILSENLHTNKFDSVVAEERVVNLANARNKCLEQASDLDSYDYIMSLETDAVFNPKDLQILFDEVKDWDILSAASYGVKEGHFYDHWATRRGADEDRWGMPMERLSDPSIPLFYGSISPLNPQTLVSQPSEVLEVYSTFNLVCLYRAEVIAKGVRFGAYSERLGSFDCDTAVICENFRTQGYTKIGMMPFVTVLHDDGRGYESQASV